MSSQYQKDSLGCRMKSHENILKNYLDAAKPVIVRLDMRAGHSFCKKFDKPFDIVFIMSMLGAADELVNNIPGCRLAYVQSDEISLVINGGNDKEQNTLMFEGAVEKIVSISSSIATLGFNKTYINFLDMISNTDKQEEAINKINNLQNFSADGKSALIERIKNNNLEIYNLKKWKGQFDSRVFNLPNTEEVRNYLMWRIMDAKRNSVSMAGRVKFSQKALNGKNTDEVIAMLEETDRPIRSYTKSERFGHMLLRTKQLKPAIDKKSGKEVIVDRTYWRVFDFDIDDISFDWTDKMFNGGRMEWTQNDNPIYQSGIFT